MIAETASAPRASFVFECYDGDTLLWREECENIVTLAGKSDSLSKYFLGSAYTAAWFIGLKGTGPAVVGDTLASHAAWSEITPYSGNRPSIVFNTPTTSSPSASTASTAVVFTANATATIYGAFVASVATGTSGLLYNAADFGTAQPVVSGNTLSVTVTFTAS